jgi:hypothetical protein
MDPMPIKAHVSTTKRDNLVELGREKEELHGSEARLDEERRAPSRIQVPSHGKNCATLRWTRWKEWGKPLLG